MGILQLERILVPIDGSECAFAAASYAIGTAQKFGPDLMLVHVSEVDHNLKLLGIYGAPYPDKIAEHVKTAKNSSQPWYEKISREALGASARVASKKVLDSPMSVVGVIVNHAMDSQADLIVIGSRCLTGFKKLLMGRLPLE